MENRVSNQLSGEALAQFQLGINLILSSWSYLQMAIENEWGGPDSRQKGEQLPIDILSHFNQTRDPVRIDYVEIIIVKSLISLYATTEGCCTYTVAEKIMCMYEECLEGNFTSIERLNEADPGTNDDKDYMW